MKCIVELKSFSKRWFYYIFNSSRIKFLILYQKDFESPIKNINILILTFDSKHPVQNTQEGKRTKLHTYKNKM